MNEYIGLMSQLTCLLTYIHELEARGSSTRDSSVLESAAVKSQ